MSHVIVTGSEGFVGRALVRRLLERGLAGRPVARLTLLDIGFAAPHPDARVRQLSGSIADPALRAQAHEGGVHAVFHLASIPGGAAERGYDQGRAINLDATLGLLEDLRGQSVPPRFVFASSIAVYGEQLPAVVDEHTLPAPALSYGAHKLIGEYLVADATRRGWVQGVSLRLPGVVARPGDGAGLMSAFMSHLFWRLRDGQPITVPVSPRATAWWISVGACADNLLHAATLDASRLDARRSYAMPVLHLSVQDVVAALAERFGAERTALVRYQSEPLIERLFGSYPPLSTPGAQALGFASDGSADRLVERALEG